MRYTSNPVRDIDADNDERQKKSDAYDRELQLCIEEVHMELAQNTRSTVNDIEEELMSDGAITACLYVREALGKEEAFAALDNAIDRAIERVAARRVKE